MRRNLGSNILFNLVMMTRQRSQRSVLLTESDQDTDFYRRFVSEPHCLVRSASIDDGVLPNREGVLANLERFSQCRVKGCAGIIDADSDYVLQRPKPIPDVFLTDKSDKETTIVDSVAFEVFCVSLSASIPATDLRRLLYESAFPIGAIRRVSDREGMGIDFKNVKVSSFITEGPACVTSKCCDEVASANPDLDLSVQTLAEFTRDAKCLSLPKANVVRGHDLVAILEAQSRSIFGREVSQRELEYELARAYSFDHFRSTMTYGDLRKWEGAMLPTYRLFSESGD